jgi:hypothetical protein
MIIQPSQLRSEYGGCKIRSISQKYPRIKILLKVPIILPVWNPMNTKFGIPMSFNFSSLSSCS